MASKRIRARRRRGNAVRVALRVLGVLVTAALVLVLVSTAVAYAVVQSWLRDIPDAKSQKVAEATKIYSADKKLIAKLYLENREVVPLSAMSPHLLHAVIAVEDERFYQHEGYDTLGIIRAAIKDISAGTVVEGASTLTQQYVRQTMLSREATQVTAARKIREIYLAQELEKRYSKDEILAMYLNTVYFGDGAWGAEAASKDFFGKSAKDLTIGEAAMLAGLPQTPRRLNPWDKENQPRAIERQHWVLYKMLEQGYITAAQYNEAIKEDVIKKLKRSESVNEGVNSVAPYFVAYVKKQLQDMYSSPVVFKGGLRVYTTLDTRMQAAAEKAAKNNLGRKGDPSVAMVAIDPRTGYIRAMVGGPGYEKSKFNLAVQGRRQPGSSFKTFVLATAIEHGIPPYRAISSDSPAVIQWTPNDWVASNSEGKGRGYITIEKATEDSVNTVFARLIEELGPKDVSLMAKRMGITSRIPEYPSIALGTSNVTPLEMASAFGTLAANGVHYKATPITKVLGPDGKELYSGKPVGSQAVSREVAFAVTQLLKKVISSGTGKRADIGRPAAGKTGTSQNYRDAWFVGYTPQLVTSVWVGYTPERAMEDVHGDRGFGGTLAAPIWHDFMMEAVEGMPPADFTWAADPNWKWENDWSRQRSNDTSGTGGSRKKRKAETPAPVPKTTPKPKPPTPEPVTPPPSGDGTGKP